MQFKIFIVFVFLLTTSAHADVHISENFNIIIQPQTLEVKAGKTTTYQLWPGEGKEANLEVNIDVNSSLFPEAKVMVCDDNEMQIYLLGNKNVCTLYLVKESRFVHIYGRKDIPTWLILDNSNSLLQSKTVVVSTNGSVKIEEEVKEKIKSDLIAGFKDFHHYVQVDQFDLNIVPCGISNAFSTIEGGHITICTELMYDTASKGLPNAASGILMHEMGHSLPNLWGSPHYSNEKAADEFAVAMLFISSNFSSIFSEEVTNPSPENIIWDLIAYFQSISDTSLEAQSALLGSQHPLSIQRVNNLQAIMSSPEIFVKRWTTEIYPHLTDAGLRSVIENPHIGANIPLAEELLNKRTYLSPMPQ